MRFLRVLAVLLVTVLLLCSCSGRFESDAAGQGYTDGKTGIFYKAMPTTFEAATRENEPLGEFEDKKFDYTLAFYVIPSLDAKLFLADANGFVYCAADPMPDFSVFSVSEVLVCDEDAISVEVFRVKDAATVAALRALWAEGEQAELPMVKASHKRRLKMASPDYPNLYYCVNFYCYEDGTAYLYDSESSRAVLCTEELTAVLKAK